MMKYILFMFAVLVNFAYAEINPADIDKKISQTREDLSSHTSKNEKVLQEFDNSIGIWRDYYLSTDGKLDLPLILKSISFAAVKHEGQFRKGPEKIPYIIHPIGVARSLWKEGNIRQINVLVAAILHDTLEDTETTPEELEKLFGARVRYTVEEVTNDPKLSGEKNKERQIEHAPQMSLNAQLVKLADRLYNVRDLRNLPPNDSMPLKYLPWAQKLLTALNGTNENLEKLLQDEIQSQIDSTRSGSTRGPISSIVWGGSGNWGNQLIMLAVDSDDNDRNHVDDHPDCS